MGVSDSPPGAAVLNILLHMHRRYWRRRHTLIPVNPGDPWDFGGGDGDEGYPDEEDFSEPEDWKFF